jgi:prepilin signal peptidase PulO-like enzyme (type II secretory pathway)
MNFSAAWKWRGARADRTTLEVRSSGVSLRRPPEARGPLVDTNAGADTGDTAAQVAERLNAWAWLGTAASAVAGSIALVTLRGHAPNAAWLGQFALVQLSGAALFAAIGAYVRGQRAQGAWPRGADIALTVSTTLLLVGSAWPAPREIRPDLIATLALALMLVARSALVPSTPERALWLAIGCAAPLVPFTYAYYGTRLEAGADPGPGLYGVYSLAFAATIVLVTHLVSRALPRGREHGASPSPQVGQYVLVRKIGGGGMGVVYEAEHQSLRRPTAIKMLRPEKTAEHNLVRFEREARLTASLCHPNTVSVYDYGRTPGGTFYYAMEYIEGIDLDMLVQHDGPQHPGRVIQILSQICGSLAEAHAVGLIHQDIKPANVFLCERAGMVDVVKVLDFGLVRRFARSEGEGRTSMIAAPQQDFVGTPHFVAPEALLGDGQVDGRTDLYSLGCVAHYLLTGGTPFVGNTVLEVLGQHLHATARPFATRAPWPISAELERLVLGCLGKSRVQRPSDAATLYGLLQHCPEALAWDPEHGRRWWAERGRMLRDKVAAARAAEATAAS